MSRLSDDYTPSTPSGSSSPDANATTKGLVQLAGDLGGTAASPTVPGLTTKTRRYPLVRAISLPGSNQNYPSTPTTALVSGTQVLDVRILAMPTTHVSSNDQHLISQWDDTANKGWKMKIVGVSGGAQNALEIAWTGDGTGTAGIPAPSRPLVGYVVDGRPVWYRAYVNPANGGGNFLARLYVSYDYDADTQLGTWTQLGADALTASAVQSIFASTAPLAIGVRNPGSGGGAFLLGSVFAAQVFRDSTLVASFDASAFTAVSAGVTYADPQGNTWTLTSGGWSLVEYPARASWSGGHDGVGTSLVTPYALKDLAAYTLAGSVNGANTGRFARVQIPRSGTLAGIAVFPNVASGNIDVAVYDTGDTSTTAATRTKLWSTGSIACPTAGSWAEVGTPNLPVRAGQWLDFYLAADNLTATFLRASPLAANVNSLPTGYAPTQGGASPKMAGFGGTFPAGATVTDASITANGTVFGFVGRIT